MRIEIPLLRNSERNDFKKCPHAWHWRWDQGLVPRTPKQDARWFGTCWHLVWAEMYTPPQGKDGFTRSSRDPHAIWEEATRNAFTSVSGQPFFGEDEKMEFFDAEKLGHAMIDGQLKLWNMDPGYEVLMPEQRFRVGIPYTQDQIERGIDWPKMFVGDEKQHRAITILVGTFDMTIYDHTDGTAKPKVLDWKTTNKRTNLKQNNKDDQLGTYCSVATFVLRQQGMIKKDQAVDEFIFSFARKAMPPDPATVDENGRIRNKAAKKHYIAALVSGATPDSVQLSLDNKVEGVIKDLNKLTLDRLAQEVAKVHPGQRIWGDVSKNQGGPLFWREPVRRNKANRARQIERIAEDSEVIANVRNGSLPLMKTPGEHCNWCDYTELCDIDEDGGDTEDFIKNVFKYADPYADHQEGARNSKETVAAKKETGVR